MTFWLTAEARDGCLKLSSGDRGASMTSVDDDEESLNSQQWNKNYLSVSMQCELADKLASYADDQRQITILRAGYQMHLN